MKKFLWKKMSLRVLAKQSLFLVFTFYLSTCLSAVLLTVDTGQRDASVAALNFDLQGNPTINSVFAPTLTDTTGKVVLTIAANTDYMVFATKQGRGPSLRDQVMMGKAIPVRTSSDMTISLQLNETISNVGTINI